MWGGPETQDNRRNMESRQVFPSMHWGSASQAGHTADDIKGKACQGQLRIWVVPGTSADPAVLLLMSCPLSGSHPSCHFPVRKKQDPRGWGGLMPTGNQRGGILYQRGAVMIDRP
ncbi:hypothetical protein JZ751_014670 [Albula glossodonta]|uniref:Uncharacterized protein n=1 Tax=Albula glossodonta TaxID=121402 RepID=A0A8T2N4F4_9TELE|nr:hypothetical protein JZ751_014670 [Albula glossodonta]